MECKLHSKQSKDQLKHSGLKITPARVKMLDIFKHAKTPINAKQIARQLRSADVDLVTVYRNLETLTEQKIIAEVNLKKDEAHYELAGTHHHHIVCERCGKIADVGNCGIHKLQYQIMKKHGFAKINRHELEFFGICKNCSKK